MFYRLYTILPANGQRSSLADQAIVPLFCPAYNAAKAITISYDHFRIVVIVLCVGLLAEIVRNVSVSAVSDIYQSGHGSRWRQMETFFRVTGPLRGESTGHQSSDAELWCFIWSSPDQTIEQTIEARVIWDVSMTSL